VSPIARRPTPRNPRRGCPVPPAEEDDRDNLWNNIRSEVRANIVFDKRSPRAKVLVLLKEHEQDLTAVWEILMKLWDQNDNGPAGLKVRAELLPKLRELALTNLKTLGTLNGLIEPIIRSSCT
jgi:hypothetical protein